MRRLVALQFVLRLDKDSAIFFQSIMIGLVDFLFWFQYMYELL